MHCYPTSTTEGEATSFPLRCRRYFRRQWFRLCEYQLRLWSLKPWAHALRLRWRLRFNPEFAIQFDKLTTANSCFLHEPCSVVRTMLCRNNYFLQQLEYLRNKKQSPGKLKQVRSRIRFPQQADYTSLLARDKRSRIIASFHFGDFVYGLNYLVAQEHSQRSCSVYSEVQGSEQYFENIRQAIGSNAADKSSQLLSSEVSMNQLSAYLREGRNTLVMFCDLPYGCGERVQVKLFNRWAWFPKGPATLALVNRVPLLPVISFLDSGHNYLFSGKQLEPVRQLDDSFEDAVARLSQQLVSFFEIFLRRYPEQWRYLQFLPGYFSNADAEAP